MIDHPWILGIKEGSIDRSIPIILTNATTGAGLTGIINTGVTAKYWRQGGSVTAITMAALGSLTAAHADGGWIEVDATNQPGEYRFDLPDAAVAAGAQWVGISLVVSGADPVFVYIPIAVALAKEVLDDPAGNHKIAGTVGASLQDIRQRLGGRTTFNHATNLLTVFDSDGTTTLFRLLNRENPTDANEQEMIPQ